MISYSKSEKLAKVQDAFDTRRLFEYLTGQAGYTYISNYADAPTDSEVVFASILDYVKGYDTQPAWHEFEYTWLAVSKSKEFAWLSVYYLFEYLNFYLTGRSTLSEHAHLTIAEVLENLKKHKASLSKDKRWVGRMYKEGLWSDVNRMLNNMNKRFNLNMSV